MNASRIARISSAAVGVLLTAGVCIWLICGAVSSNGTSAAKEIKHVYFKSTITALGNKDLVSDVWFILPDKRRVESGDEIIVNNGRDYWVYNKASKRLLVGKYAPDDLPLFDPNKWVRSGIESMWRSQDPNLKEKNVRRKLRGVERDAVELELYMEGQHVRVAIFEDKSSGRAIATITEFLQSGNVIRSQMDEFDYNRPIDEKLFSLEPPSDAVPVKQDTNPKWRCVLIPLFRETPRLSQNLVAERCPEKTACENGRETASSDVLTLEGSGFRQQCSPEGLLRQPHPFPKRPGARMLSGRRTRGAVTEASCTF